MLQYPCLHSGLHKEILTDYADRHKCTLRCDTWCGVVFPLRGSHFENCLHRVQHQSVNGCGGEISSDSRSDFCIFGIASSHASRHCKKIYLNTSIRLSGGYLEPTHQNAKVKHAECS